MNIRLLKAGTTTLLLANMLGGCSTILSDCGGACPIGSGNYPTSTGVRNLDSGPRDTRNAKYFVNVRITSRSGIRDGLISTFDRPGQPRPRAEYNKKTFTITSGGQKIIPAQVKNGRNIRVEYTDRFGTYDLVIDPRNHCSGLGTVRNSSERGCLIALFHDSRGLRLDDIDIRSTRKPRGG